jgi:hypothetical protein
MLQSCSCGSQYKCLMYVTYCTSILLSLTSAYCLLSTCLFQESFVFRKYPPIFRMALVLYKHPTFFNVKTRVLVFASISYLLQNFSSLSKMSSCCLKCKNLLKEQAAYYCLQESPCLLLLLSVTNVSCLSQASFCVLKVPSCFIQKSAICTPVCQKSLLSVTPSKCLTRASWCITTTPDCHESVCVFHRRPSASYKNLPSVTNVLLACLLREPRVCYNLHNVSYKSLLSVTTSASHKCLLAVTGVFIISFTARKCVWIFVPLSSQNWMLRVLDRTFRTRPQKTIPPTVNLSFSLNFYILSSTFSTIYPFSSLFD